MKKQVEDSAKYQKKAEDKVGEKKNPEAADAASDAIAALKKAEKELEDLLAQLREEELERLLGKLEGRVKLMLDMQIEVRDATVELNKTYGGKKLDDIQKNAMGQGSAVQADKEDEIVKEANKAIELLRAEGSAVAFTKAFEDVRKDMVIVRENLKRTDVAEITQAVEGDIIASLQDMLEALKQARKDPQKKKDQQPPPPPGAPPRPQDQKLISDLAELKMIRSLQERLNSRTEIYGKQVKTEQVPPLETAASKEQAKKLAEIIDQFKDLGKRQEELGKVANDIYKGRNEKR